MDPKEQLAAWERMRDRDQTHFLRTIQRNLISAPFICNPLFGNKKSIYLDHFASSKALNLFEDIMRQTVLPFYANTHTSTTSTSKFTSQSVKHARETIRRCTNAIATDGHEHQAAVIFSGAGATSGIHKIRSALRLEDEAYWIRKAQSISSTAQFSFAPASTPLLESALLSSCTSNQQQQQRPLSQTFSHLPSEHRPVVFLSIQEHHSNLLPWRDSCADVVVIPEDGAHKLDLAYLEEQLILYQARPLKLGSFSAGSNLTGVLNDTVAISELLHKYGGFAFYDYAGVGPYTSIDMNPPSSNPTTTTTGTVARNLAYKDGVFISTHKFLGGPGASGVLVARTEIFSWAERNSGATSRNEFIPATPGGGTVDMVIKGQHKYSNNILAREEAGTPNIPATIRTGLVFRLQEIANPAWILQKEYKLAKRVLSRLLSPNLNQAIHVLGASELDRVAVISLTIAVPKFLSHDGKSPLQIHYALLSTIMNDFFGIEMRGGCMCAGPYASQLLQFDADKEAAFWKLLMGEQEEGPRPGYIGDNTSEDGEDESNDAQPKNIHQQELSNKSLKPGFVRFSFTYFSKDKDVEFVVQSLEWVAQYGYLLIPLYRLDASSGEWNVREAVRKAVCADIAPKNLICGSRGLCIPAAVDCIYSLQKLFRERVTPTWLWASPPASSLTRVSSPMDQTQAQSQRGPYLTANSAIPPPPASNNNRASHSEIFSTLGQAQRSLRRVITGAFGRSEQNVARPGSNSRAIDHHDDEDVHHPGHTHGLPQINEPHSDVSSIASGTGACSSSEYEDAVSSPPLSGLDSRIMSTLANSNHNNPVSRTYSNESYSSSILSLTSSTATIESTSAATMSKRHNSNNKPSIFSAERHIKPKDRQILLDALNELSWDLLKAEVDAVEHSPLAKQLRWFVTPLDVVQMYTEELANPSATSPFPKRR
ncbi:MAG: pyridoxal phosphate-dependent transferase [Linnemannia gamsii]|nr:MAG: pyridoxal phosphate-dependent transferase [Linnemannia gamsii]